MSRIEKIALMAVACSLGAGCAGARTDIVAPAAQYPVSLSKGVRDADGTMVPEERKVTVATFHQDRTAWGTFYSAAKLTPKTDISQAINQQVRAAGGDAVVNLRVASVHCRGAFWPLVSIIPVWPACTKLRVQGDIVVVIPKAPGEGEDDGPPARPRAAAAPATRTPHAKR